MNTPKTLGLGGFLLVFFCASASAQGDFERLRALARGEEPGAYAFAQEHGAILTPTADGRTMVLSWQSHGFDAAEGITFVSLHGSNGWVTRDLEVWHPYLEHQGWAYLGLQWWDGQSDRSYLQPHEILRYLREALYRHRVTPGRAILAGFSRGAANSYAVAYLDRMDDDGPYFGAVLSNAGEMANDFPPNRPFMGAHADKKPFAGLPWVLYCGQKDLERPQSCEDMVRTKAQLERGGAVVELVRDPEGGHGGLMRPRMNRRVLDLLEKVSSA